MQDAIELLLTSDLLGGVTEDELRALSPPPAWVSVAAGDTLIRQGEPGEAFYLLVRGRLRVFVSGPDGVGRRVGEVLPGECAGEMSLLTGEPTSATVRAMHDCDLVRFSRESYMQLVERSPEVMLGITRTVIKRLRQGLSGPQRTLSYRTIAVVPIDPAVDRSSLAALLAKHLGPFGSACAPHRGSLDPDLARLAGRRDRLQAADDHAVTSRLAAWEREHDLVVYQADPEPTAWTRLCIRQADMILLVATVGADPALSANERSLINHLDPDLAPRTDLVLLHPAEWQPCCGSARWLAPRNVAELHHLRRWHDGDFARLARILTGNAVCLVLGGGGARSFAQIGVLRALHEAGVPIDRVGGTSMGSIIGAQFALGQSVDEIARRAREIWVEGRPLSDYTFPAISIVRGRRLHKLVKSALAGWDIEDLPISYFCVSGSLTADDLVVHDRGPLWEAVRASGSIPGAGPPMFRGGDILVDGGVINSLPGDIMRDRHGGILIIVDAARQVPIAVPEDLDDVPPSGWRILWGWINPFATPVPVPTIFEILYRAATMSSVRQSATTRKLADLLIAPPLAHFGTLQFEAVDEIIDIGYRHAAQRLRELDGGRLRPFVSPERLPAAATAPTPEQAAGIAQRARRRRTQRRPAAAAIACIALVGAWAFLTGGSDFGSGSSRGDAPALARAGDPAAGSADGGRSPAMAPLGSAPPHRGVNVLSVDAVAVRMTDGYEAVESYAGRVVSRRTSDLGFERSGLLVEVAVDEGAAVSRGDLLARLDSRSLAARRQELQARMARHRATRQQSEAELQLARVTVERLSKLMRGDNVSRQSYDEAMFREQALASQLAAKAAEVEEVAAALTAVAVEIEKSAIYAPFDGSVADRFLDEGVAVGAGSPVLRLIEDGVKEVRVGVPRPVAHAMRVGETHDVEVEGRIYRGRLRALLPAIDAATRTVPALLEIQDSGRRLRWGELARLRMTRTVPMQGFWLPISALIGGEQGLWNVYALEPLADGSGGGLMRVSRREVQMLHSEADRMFVRGTLRDGDRVVSSGLHRVVPNQIVRLE